MVHLFAQALFFNIRTVCYKSPYTIIRNPWVYQSIVKDKDEFWLKQQKKIKYLTEYNTKLTLIVQWNYK